MLLAVLVVFFKLLNIIDLNHCDEADVLHLLNLPDIKPDEDKTKNIETTSDGKPPLVPLEFPPDFFKEEGPKVVAAIEKKMGKFFGESTPLDVTDINSKDRMLDYLSHFDFNSSWINYFVRSYINKLRTTENISVEDIKNKKECKRACYKKQNGITAYLQSCFESAISKLTHEDFRFWIGQDPKKCFKFTINPETQKPECHCVEDGYMIKVSPRIKEIIQEKYFGENGKSLLESKLDEDMDLTFSKVREKFSLMNVGRFALHLTGLKRVNTRDDDFGDWFIWHLIIGALIFFICPCILPFYLIYVFLDFFANSM